MVPLPSQVVASSSINKGVALYCFEFEFGKHTHKVEDTVVITAVGEDMAEVIRGTYRCEVPRQRFAARKAPLLLETWHV